MDITLRFYVKYSTVIDMSVSTKIMLLR